MKSDAESFIRKYDKCQHFAPVIYLPIELLSFVSGPNPFMKLSMDIVGPLSVASEQRKFVRKWRKPTSSDNSIK